ncbi:MAG: CPBP family glutamic-type intramembrane protease [Nitrosopumilus sp.]|nr:CPBP family glutamic-type intramembrane protease [Nitrosopumilus sp.]MDH3486955.1 CPBP family glutamic-type intramembrane protease [Nitrosopumilus sp.]
MENSNRILQFLGIPFAGLQSVILGLLLVSFPIGIYIVFESEIGGDINYEYPLTYLALFKNTELYQVSFDVSIGDVFVIFWIFYVVLFTIAIFGPKHGFLKSLSPIISFGKFNTTSNYMIEITKWFSILILISALINFIQEAFGIVTIPPLDDNDLIQFFYVSLAPLIEEFGFRLILVGIPLFAMYSHKSTLKYFIKCLWIPSSLHINNYKKALLLITFVGVFFGFAHIAFAESWSEGKFAQAAASGVILGWVYLRYGFVASLLIHWAMNYFIFSYANFISQLNDIPIQESFSHSLMSSLEMLFLISGAISISILFVSRFYSKKESILKV